MAVLRVRSLGTEFGNNSLELTSTRHSYPPPAVNAVVCRWIWNPLGEVSRFNFDLYFREIGQNHCHNSRFFLLCVFVIKDARRFGGRFSFVPVRWISGESA
jgi:hypothetical protein